MKSNTASVAIGTFCCKIYCRYIYNSIDSNSMYSELSTHEHQKKLHSIM